MAFNELVMKILPDGLRYSIILF